MKRNLADVEYEMERINEICGEVTKLNDKFEWMLQKLKETEEKLETLAEKLETPVERRTPWIRRIFTK